MEGDHNAQVDETRRFISIHALRVEGDTYDFGDITYNRISIHALRVEGDGEQLELVKSDMQFLSTPSGWRATGICDSTYALNKFLSTPSGWRATALVQARLNRLSFLSTPSGWRATLGTAMEKVNIKAISIHALRVEGDS